ncbi:MAG: CDP-diacylglycerol--glycerol-3-phosphate 3-phosphatidyltransferase [Bdellovibrionales bacterium]|nr:CDP-diacylglycerol--glycerol-3-phosphate 3-phosphatidyltransferase [Bdellovibrionales bacterium]
MSGESKTEIEVTKIQVKIPFDELTFHTAPNYLTVLRIAFVPAVIALLNMGAWGGDFLAAAVFGVAAATDWLDGHLARKYNIETIYGKLMDPLADKFLVICSLIMLQSLGRIHPFIVMILVCRELTITGLRALASAEGIIVAASPGGKWKTAFQMIAIPLMMVQNLDPTPLPFHVPFYTIGLWMTYVSVVMSLWSAKDYIVEFFVGLTKARAHKKELKRLKKLEKKNRS